MVPFTRREGRRRTFANFLGIIFALDELPSDDLSAEEASGPELSLSL